MVLSGTKSSCRPVTSIMTEGWIQGPILFNIFMNVLNDGTEGIFSKFADDTKMAGVVARPAGWFSHPEGPG